MVEIIWEFRVRAGRERDFETAYGPDGVWAKLFSESPAYHGTTLLRDRDDPHRYLTIDRWDTADAFANFRDSVHDRYHAVDRECEALTESETRIGTFDSLD